MTNFKKPTKYDNKPNTLATDHAIIEKADKASDYIELYLKHQSVLAELESAKAENERLNIVIIKLKEQRNELMVDENGVTKGYHYELMIKMDNELEKVKK